MNSFEEFITTYPSATFEKGQTLLLKDTIPQYVYIIESGLVKSYTITAAGDERLLSINSKGEDLPVGYALGLVDQAPCFYEAYTKCTVRLVPREAYMLHLHTSIASLQRQYTRLTILLLAMLSRISALEQPRAGDKIASTLMYMADQVGVRLRPQKTQLRLEITQQEIANLLGLTRETTSIELKKLEIKRLLTHSRKSYVVHMERLKAYLESVDDR